MNVKYLVNLVFLISLILTPFGCGNVDSGITVKDGVLTDTKNTSDISTAEPITVNDVSFSGTTSQDISVDLSTLINGFNSTKKYVYTIVSPPNNGFISIFNELLVYSPSIDGVDTIQFKVASGDSNSNIGTITFSISAPIVDSNVSELLLKDLSKSILADEVLTIDLTEMVVGFDSNKVYNFVVKQVPSLGTVSKNSSTITYTPFPSVIGNDVITIVAGDGNTTSNIGQITINIQDQSTSAPRWGTLSLDVPKGGPLNVDLRTLLLAPHPFDGKVYTFTLLQNAKNGTATISGNNLSFTAVQFGIDTNMRILVTDDLGQSSEGKFTLNITP